VALSLPLRNRLAELTLDAFHDDEARRTLRALARFCEADGEGLEAGDVARLAGLGWFRVEAGGRLRLEGAHAAQQAALCRRARAATAMLEDVPSPGDGPTLLLDRAARLADHGLYFEVHELLEPAWIRAEGEERAALQGLIQVAVAFHHAENGNPQGTESLLAEGLVKLRASGHALPLPIGTWVAALDAELAGLRAGRPPRPPVPWPRPTETPWRSS
jgi:hypothetical protein